MLVVYFVAIDYFEGFGVLMVFAPNLVGVWFVGLWLFVYYCLCIVFVDCAFVTYCCLFFSGLEMLLHWVLLLVMVCYLLRWACCFCVDFDLWLQIVTSDYDLWAGWTYVYDLGHCWFWCCLAFFIVALVWFCFVSVAFWI